MSTRHDIAAIATRLIRAYDSATQIAPITDEDPTFDVAAAYDVLREIENRRRIAQGWHTVGTQDRLHQHDDLVALRRVSADVGAHLDALDALREGRPRDARR